MTNVKRITTVFLLIVCLMCMLSFVVTAADDPDPIASVLKSCSTQSAFEEKWEKSASVYDGSTYVGKMVYGYDTFLVNEDYANTLGSGKRSMSALWRKGYDENPTKADIEKSGTWSKCSLRHKEDTTVYYYGNFYDN